jgi:cytoskeletal protein CcmA (bactofilin family)
VFNRNRHGEPMKSTAENHADTGDDASLNLQYTLPMADITTGKNLLSADVEIKGSIKFLNELTIDGKVEGDITSAGILTVGENAEIHAEIKTKSVTVLGKVTGNITVEERCELKARAVLQGDLKAARLVIEEGATFIGKSEVSPNKVTPMKPEVMRTPEAAKPAAGGR